MTVRPMTDRVREAVFNLFRKLIDDRPVFDVFAGSGAIGLEALSRGASHAHFVEFDARITRLLKRNVRTLGYEDRVTVTQRSAYHWAPRFRGWPDTPVLLFIAPPYFHFLEKETELRTIIGMMLSRVAADSAVAIQAPTSSSISDMPQGPDWEMRRYGETHLIFCQTTGECLEQTVSSE